MQSCIQYQPCSVMNGGGDLQSEVLEERIKGRGREGWEDGLQKIWTDLDQNPALTSAKLNKSIWNSDLFLFSFVRFNIKRYLLYWKFAKTAFCLKISEFHMHTKFPYKILPLWIICLCLYLLEVFNQSFDFVSGSFIVFFFFYFIQSL